VNTLDTTFCHIIFFLSFIMSFFVVVTYLNLKIYVIG
jgi:hypothetical protein